METERVVWMHVKRMKWTSSVTYVVMATDPEAVGISTILILA